MLACHTSGTQETLKSSDGPGRAGCMAGTYQLCTVAQECRLTYQHPAAAAGQAGAVQADLLSSAKNLLRSTFMVSR